MQQNRLIFGKNEETHIVNVTLKNETLFLYKEIAGKVQEERFSYSPWVLTNRQARPYSERLKGNQYWSWMTSTTCEKFAALQGTWNQKVWLPRSVEECFFLCEGFTYFKGMQVADVSILSFDIEGSGLVMDDTSEVFIIANTFRKNGVITKKIFSLDDFHDDVHMMICSWISWVHEVDPSIICGHNIFSYDLRYLEHVYGKPLHLGRDNSALVFDDKVSRFRKDGSQQYDYHNARITGREIVDTFFLSMKYDQAAREFPSYGLKPIVKFLGLEKQGRVFVDPSKTREYYENRATEPQMWENVKAYSLDDSEDALKLFDKMIPASFYFTQSVPSSLQTIVNTATGSQINNFMVRSYLQDGHSIARADQIKDHLAGGISFGVPGLYRNVFKIDLKSAYPSQILRFKLYDKDKDPQAYFYEMVKYFTLERFELKAKYKETGQQYFKDREQTSKIFINSAYGALSTNYLNYNSPKLAAKITEETRNVIDFALKWASSKDKNYWIKLFEEKTGAA